ncbi:MAG: DUF2019 domain-containing protein [candidate division Zixibacteria bacterium]|nr:DUF2019 domain-containing protein [candidate division Zixibacteria bacterium]
MSRKSSHETLLETFIDATVARHEAMLKSDFRRANRFYRKSVAAYRLLVERGDRTLLVNLLENPNASVRCASATYLLSTMENRALEVLRSLARGDYPVASFEAKGILHEWEKGTLDVP